MLCKFHEYKYGRSDKILSGIWGPGFGRAGFRFELAGFGRAKLDLNKPGIVEREPAHFYNTTIQSILKE